jgi:hypothetical protein
MADSSFDAARAVRFDLPSGSVRAAGDARVALVPVEALAAVGKSGAAEEVAGIVGGAIGKRVASRLGAASGATVEAFATALGGELAVAGYGSLSVERWGRALVLVVEHTALPDAMLGTLLASAIAATSTRGDVTCAALGTEDETARFLVTSKSSAARVRGWIDGGVKWGEALARLHSKSGGDA